MVRLWDLEDDASAPSGLREGVLTIAPDRMYSLIGIGATVMDGAVVGDNCIVAGHCIVTEGAVIPPNSVVAGVPGKVVARRNNYVDNKVNAYSYYRNALAYVQGDHRLWSREDYQSDLSAARARYEQDPEAASE